MSFSVSVEGKVGQEFLEKLGDGVLKAVAQAEQGAHANPPAVDEDATGQKRAQQEAAYTQFHDAASPKVERAKALIFRGRDAFLAATNGAAGQLGPGAIAKGTLSGHASDDGKSDSLRIDVTVSSAPPDAAGAGEAEKKAEGLVESQVSGPQASPAAAGRVAAAEAGQTPPQTVSIPSEEAAKKPS